MRGRVRAHTFHTAVSVIVLSQVTADKHFFWMKCLPLYSLPARQYVSVSWRNRSVRRLFERVRQALVDLRRQHVRVNVVASSENLEIYIITHNIGVCMLGGNSLSLFMETTLLTRVILTTCTIPFLSSSHRCMKCLTSPPCPQQSVQHFISAQAEHGRSSVSRRGEITAPDMPEY